MNSYKVKSHVILPFSKDKDDPPNAQDGTSHLGILSSMGLMHGRKWTEVLMS